MPRRILEGLVVSSKADKTVTVRLKELSLILYTRKLLERLRIILLMMKGMCALREIKLRL